MKNHKIFWLLPAVLVTNTGIYTQAPNFIWTRQVGVSGYNEGEDMALDKSGNVFAIWNSEDSGFVTKFDVSGNVVWQRETGDYGRAVATHASGNVIVIVDSLSSTPVLSRDIFIINYGDNGELIWLRQAGGVGEDLPQGATVDAFGDIIVTGDFEGTATFSDTSLTTMNSEAMFLVKYDLDGALLWARKFSRLDSDSGLDIATDNVGNILVLGRSYESNSDDEMFVAKFDREGQFLWQQAARSFGQAIAIDL